MQYFSITLSQLHLMNLEEEAEEFDMLQPARKSDRMCYPVAMTMRSSCMHYVMLHAQRNAEWQERPMLPCKSRGPWKCTASVLTQEYPEDEERLQRCIPRFTAPVVFVQDLICGYALQGRADQISERLRALQGR